jgi:hypothetical protein
MRSRGGVLTARGLEEFGAGVGVWGEELEDILDLEDWGRSCGRDAAWIAWGGWAAVCVRRSRCVVGLACYVEQKTQFLVMRLMRGDQPRCGIARLYIEMSIQGQYLSLPYLWSQ